ncbi:hypothetical protein ACLOJK_007248 [Asimina triloba]
MGQRDNRVVGLEAKAVDASKALHQDLFIARLEQERLKEDMIGLLSDLAAPRAEWDEAINSAEAGREEASWLSVELTVAKSEALRTRDVDSNVNVG